MRRPILLFLALFLLAGPAALAYNIVLKNGSILFARDKYTVKGAKAIITLQNGTVVSYDLDQIDVPATEKYNKENPGNVIAIETGLDKALPVPVATPVPTASLQEMLRRRNVSLGVAPTKTAKTEAAGSGFQPVESTVEQVFRRTLDGASITQYRLTSYRGKVRLLATANTEEAVFNILSASARVLSDLGSRGKELGIEIVLTTASGESAGSFEMNQEQARQLVNGNTTAADFFIRNVVL